MSRMLPEPIRKPRAELHLHLEGSLTPEILLELEPELDPREIASRMQFDGFGGFLQAYIWTTQYLRTPSDYSLVTRRLVQHLFDQGVTYAELTLSAGMILWRKQDLAAVYAEVRKESLRGPVEIHWILDAIRHFGVEAATPVAEFAASQVNNGVVGFGIGGDEVRGPAIWFRELFAFATSKGLHLTPHAGETDGPQSIWDALECGAERIGHGIRAIDDPVLVRHLADNQIPLEICLSSNVATGVVASIREHPARRLFDAGVPITLNTDDPGLFRTSLTREFDLASRELGFSQTDMDVIAQNALDCRFGKGSRKLQSS